MFRVDSSNTESVLFNLDVGGTVGANPWAGLVMDQSGNFYGTASDGALGYGSVFELDPAGNQTVLHAFAGGMDGAYPAAALTRDSAGNLYGTTMGCYPLNVCGDMYGKVFEVDSAGNFSVLHTFTGQGTDGETAWTGLVADAAGNLYGASRGGGAFGVGTIFKLDTAGTYTTLYSFQGRADGKVPEMGNLILDAAGNLYGTVAGGIKDYGLVFRLNPAGEYTVLYNFAGGADGGLPNMPLVRDASGNLYGTTLNGGTTGCGGPGCGTIFKLDPKGKKTILHKFTSGTDGANPLQGLIRDATGVLYGTTEWGGDPNVKCGNTTTGCGAVFRFATH